MNTSGLTELLQFKCKLMKFFASFTFESLEEIFVRLQVIIWTINIFLYHIFLSMTNYFIYLICYKICLNGIYFFKKNVHLLHGHKIILYNVDCKAWGRYSDECKTQLQHTVECPVRRSALSSPCLLHLRAELLLHFCTIH